MLRGHTPTCFSQQAGKLRASATSSYNVTGHARLTGRARDTSLVVVEAGAKKLNTSTWQFQLLISH